MNVRTPTQYSVSFTGADDRLVEDIIKLTRSRNALVVQMVPYQNGTARRAIASPRQRYIPPEKIDKSKFTEARDIVYAVVKQANGPIQRKFITKALVARNYSAKSTGPICHLLKRDGVIFSPRRGLWQMKQ